MKGCPLSCVWCHNPEGISSRKQKLYTKKKCIGCRTCVEACPEQALTLTPEGIVTDGARCTLCGICAEVCPAMAMEISGTEYSAEALMKIEKEIVFMDRSEGGVTFCGGEPLLHPGPLLDLLRRCGERGIHRAVDTTLFARPACICGHFVWEDGKSWRRLTKTSVLLQRKTRWSWWDTPMRRA